MSSHSEYLLDRPWRNVPMDGYQRIEALSSDYIWVPIGEVDEYLHLNLAAHIVDEHNLMLDTTT